MKKFSKFQLASFKRTAQNVYPLVRRQERLAARMAELQQEFESNQRQIDAYEAPVKEATGGFTTDDLFVREVIEGTDKHGRLIKTTVYRLKYPDTIVPPEDDANECHTFDPNETTEPHVDIDFDEVPQPTEIDPFDMRLS